MASNGDDNPQQNREESEKDLMSKLTSSNGVFVSQVDLEETLPGALKKLNRYFELARGSKTIDYEGSPSFAGNGNSLADYGDLAGLLALALASSQDIDSVQHDLTKIVESHGGRDSFNDNTLSDADNHVTSRCKAAVYNAPGTTNSRHLVFAYGISRQEDNLYIVYFEIGRERGSHSTISYALVRNTAGILKGAVGMVDLHGHITDYFGLIGTTRRYLKNEEHPAYTQDLDGPESLKQLLVELTKTKTRVSPFSS